MRIIDADKLKERIITRLNLDICPTTVEETAVLEEIDNAPTVETFTKDDMAGAYNEGYMCGSRESERPKGEWSDHTTCPFCNHTYDLEYNFCPNCGADMRIRN